MSANPEIVPAMKVGDFLEAFPGLEEALIEASPQFQKLKNPVLRRTVAKIVTLRQAARTADLPVSELLNTLRKAAGQSPLELEEIPAGYGGEKPLWLDGSHPVERFDVTDEINSGGAPVKEVLEVVGRLPEGTVLELITPILPSPIIEKVRSQGFDSWSNETSGSFSTFFFR